MIKKITPLLFWVFILVLCLSSTTKSIAQNKNLQLTILNEETNAPISNATYTYGRQSGITDLAGTFEINKVENEKLYISHLAYGTLIFEGEQLENILRTKNLTLPEVSFSIQPLTVVAMHPTADHAQNINIKAQDRLAHDAGELLTSIPFIAGIKKSGNYGIDPVLRGFKYDQLNIVINGTPCASAACPNRMDPPTSQVAPNMVGNIEILKGPHAMRFGNAFGGTINFINVKSAFAETPTPYGRVSGHYSTNGNIKRSEALVGIKGRRYNLGIFGSWSEGDDYSDGDDNTVQADFLRGSIGIHGSYKLGDHQKLEATITRNKARDTEFPALPMDLRNDDTWLTNASHNITFSNRILQKWHTSVYLTQVDHYMDNLLKIIDPRMMDASTDALTLNYGGRTEGKWTYNNVLLYTGADVRIQYAEGERTRKFLMGPTMGKLVIDNAWQEALISNYGLFTELNLISSETVYSVSVRLDINNAQAKDAEATFLTINGSNESADMNVSASLGATQQLSNNVKLGVWLGRAQRSASITERYINSFPVGIDPYELLGNPNLKPETNNQLDINLTFQHKQTLFKVEGFGSLLSNYISSTIDTSLTPVIPSSPGVRRYQNIDKAFLSGFEISYRQTFFKRINHQFDVAYTYGKNLTLKEALPEIAPIEMNYHVKVPMLNNKIVPGINLRWVGQQARIAKSFGENSSPDFMLINAQLSYKPVSAMQIHVGVNNLLNTTYYEHLSRSVRGTKQAINETGRNFFITLVYQFNNE